MSTNRLGLEKSPYLFQHAHNPVNWYPWGKDAFEKARESNIPIFLSIGYATCHWCHVMAHECFEDETVAKILNQHFVSIKVDREERPDIDKIYMDVCQAFTGRGGWPLSAFLTPDGTAFFAGTYFPKTSRMGLPGFVDILGHMAALWANDRQRLEQTGKAVLDAIYAPPEVTAKGLQATVNADLFKKGAAQLAKVFDPNAGGFGAAPKFPTPHHLTFLLRWFRRSHDHGAFQMVEKTLRAMRHGGIFDQVGFGFHRYSVDDRWFVPHFEKMLYDQALLAMAYMEAFQVSGNPLFSQVAQEIFTYVLRDMKAPQGGFCAAQDADSEGKEGLFYLWTHEEVYRRLGKNDADLFCRFYGITEGGNFENGKSIPYVRMSMEAFSRREKMAPSDLEKVLNESRDHLFLERKKRIHPLKDDKVLTSWNGLMIAALAKGAQVFSHPAYRQAADEAARFVLKHLRNKEGRLLRRYREGEAAYPAYLDDYAFLVWGLIELYEATFDVAHLETAIFLTQEMIDLFWDSVNGGLFFTGIGNEPLVARSKDVYDGALPSGNSVALLNFLRLSRMTGNMEFDRRAGELVESFVQKIEEQPMAYTQFLSGCDFMVGPSKEIVISGDPGDAPTQAMIDRVLKPFLPNAVLLVRSPGAAGSRLAKIAPFVESMSCVEGRPTAYVCEGAVCRAPTSDMNQLASLLNGISER